MRNRPLGRRAISSIFAGNPSSSPFGIRSAKELLPAAAQPVPEAHLIKCAQSGVGIMTLRVELAGVLERSPRRLHQAECLLAKTELHPEHSLSGIEAQRLLDQFECQRKSP